MRSSARSLLVFAIYMFLLGATLVLRPDLLFALFRTPPPVEPWIRLVGMFILYLSFYYAMAAVRNLRSFICLTIYARGSVIGFLAALTVAGLVPARILILGAIDLVAAIWTALRLRAEGASR